MSVIAIFRTYANITVIGYLSAKAKSLIIVEPVIQEADFDKIEPTIDNMKIWNAKIKKVYFCPPQFTNLTLLKTFTMITTPAKT